MHANGRGWHTAEALPHVIEELRKRGFEFATVSELLAKGEPIIADSCYELKQGDQYEVRQALSGGAASRYATAGWKRGRR